MLLPEGNILSFIPQREPFVMVDQVVYSDETITRSTFRVKEDNIFVVDGFLREPGLVENMAQTAAAREGYRAVQENQPVRVGYIGAVSELVITGLPRINSDFTTEITIEKQIFNVVLISAQVICQEDIIARCKMKIFISLQ